MRLSDLLGAVVRDPSGDVVGTVTDVRMVQDGPVLGTFGAAFRVEGLIVSRRHTGSYLGYDRGTVHGPLLVEKLVAWLHRHAAFVPWDDVESWEHLDVRLRVGRDALGPVPPLPS